jgi:hypothetical protein
MKRLVVLIAGLTVALASVGFAADRARDSQPASGVGARSLDSLRSLGMTMGSPEMTTGSAPPEASKALARDIFEELIEINTSDSVGDNTAAAEAMAARLLAAGFPAADVQVLVKSPRKGNLVARYPGTGERPPILLLAHLDVVEAHPDDWSFDPFEFREIDGFFYGRGTSDDKAMAAIWINTQCLCLCWKAKER